MSQPRKWFLGLIPVAALLAIAGVTQQSGIERDLSIRGSTALKEAGLGWAQVKLSGRDAVVLGEAPDPALKSLAVSAADRAAGIRVVTDQMTVLAEAKPFTLSAMRDGARVVLSGFVPNAAQKATINAIASKAMPGVAVVDELKFARGAPANFEAAASFGLGELGKLSQGTLALSDSALSLTGRAADLPKWTDVRSKLAALPAGVTLGKGLGEGDILAPIVKPYLFGAEKTESALVLTGFVPNTLTRETILAAANALGKPVTDRLQIGDGAPAPYLNHVDFALTQLGKLATGQVALSDTALTIGGRAATIPGFADVQARLAALPQAMTLAKQDVLPPVMRPYLFSAEKTESGVTLSGYMPNNLTRETIMAGANVLGRPVTDRLQIADGAPAPYLTHLVFALDQLGRLATGQVSLSDTALTITGKAATTQNFVDVRARLAALPQGMTLAKQDIAPPIVRPYVFEAEKTANGVVLTGFVPSEAVRGAILQAAQALGRPVTDRLQLAEGVPSGDFAATARALVAELAKLQSGKATLTDAEARIAGMGSAGVNEASVRNDLRALPQGFRLVSAQIEEAVIRPYLFNATRGDGVLTLSGHVPDQPTRTGIVDHARRFFEGDRVDDTLQIGAGAPQGFANAARAGLADLARLLPGSSFSMSDASVALRGLAPYDLAREQILGDFRGKMASGFAGVTEINTAPPPPPISALPECQILFNDVLGRARILFATGSATLAPESIGVLDRLVIVARRCESAKFEIAGHTDSDGSVESNNDLSRRRAETVAQFLSRAGLSTDRLEPVGFGPSRPVAANDTAENKAKNRRIEVTVK